MIRGSRLLFQTAGSIVDAGGVASGSPASAPSPVPANKDPVQLRKRTLRLFRECLKLSRTWEGPLEEKIYIRDEAFQLFRHNSNVEVEEIEEKMFECESRIALALHYRIPYPRSYYCMKGSRLNAFARVKCGYMHSSDEFFTQDREHNLHYETQVDEWSTEAKAARPKKQDPSDDAEDTGFDYEGSEYELMHLEQAEKSTTALPDYMSRPHYLPANNNENLPYNPRGGHQHA
eukprot:NODE_3982_length_854_cov_24.698137_g3304_i0.p1 GENE.NODE_3982_length_854_cov_24.698137_g3304_i0~~NODE_3982_length_854_cov_24.698137_g3304_i0.p1  ORF type:complete len:232 (+),score=32.25 NODE_3982_length_854_cov_24.698137_g3304_i0:65-760(+)